MQVRPPCLIWLSMLVAASSLAQPAPYFAEHEVPDPAVVARLLSLPAPTTSPSAPRTRTRAVRLLENVEAQGVSPRDTTTSGVGHEAPLPDRSLPDRFMPVAERVAVLAPQRLSSVGSLALAMRFDSNSIDVLPGATVQLDAIAAGIKRLPAGALVVIEGHTDAYGADEYNRALSLQRAFAVRRYLVRQHGIPGAMLVAIGRGKSAPLKGSNPFAAENRRVEFRAEYEMQSAVAAQMLTNLLFAPADRPQ